MNIDKKRRAECVKSNCKFKNRCVVFYGNDCTKLGGSKIPVHRVVIEQKPKPSLIKPHFDELAGWNPENILIKEG